MRPIVRFELPRSPHVLDNCIEHRNEQQRQNCCSKHSAENSGADRLSAGSACASWRSSEESTPRMKAKAVINISRSLRTSCLHRSIDDNSTLKPSPFRELNYEDGVLRRETNQHD